MIKGNADITQTDYYQYALKCIKFYETGDRNDTIVCGRYIYLAAKRFLNDLNAKDANGNDKWIFKPKVVEKYRKFIAQFKHDSGAAGEEGAYFHLMPFQAFMVAQAYGFYFSNNPKKRRFATVTYEVSRKQGKSMLCAALAIAELFFGGSNPNISVTAAGGRPQARMIFDMVQRLCRQLNDELPPNILKVMKNSIRLVSNDGTIFITAAEPRRLDGLSLGPSFFLDEIEALTETSRGSGSAHELAAVLMSSTGARTNATLFRLFTAGYDINCYAYECREQGIRILEGEIYNDATEQELVLLFEMDDEDWVDDKWAYEPWRWEKTSPLVRYSRECFDKIKYAVSESLTEGSIYRRDNLIKHFNGWSQVQQCDDWIDYNKIAAVTRPLSLDEFDKNELIWASIDLAQVVDFSAVTLLQVNQEGKFLLKTFYYCPIETINKHKNRVEMLSKNDIIAQDGATNDIRYILNDIKKLIDEGFQIAQVNFDRYASGQLQAQGEELGLFMVPQNQSSVAMSPYIKTLQKLILDGKVVIDDNSCTNWQWSCVQTKIDLNGNVKLIKRGMDGKRNSNPNLAIDGLITMTMAVAAYCQSMYGSTADPMVITRNGEVS